MVLDSIGCLWERSWPGCRHEVHRNSSFLQRKFANEKQTTTPGRFPESNDKSEWVGGGSVTPLCPHTWHPSGGIFVIAVPRRHRPAIKSPKKPESKNKINVLGRQYENTVSGNELLPASPAPLPLFTDCFAKQSGRHLGTADGLCIYSCHLTETNSWLYFKLGSVILDTLEVAYLYDAWRDLWEVRVNQRKTTPNR